MRNINDYTHQLWVHTPDDAFDGQTGFVPCTKEEFSKYKNSAIAQDPARGANHLNSISGTYKTKVMVAEKPKRTRRRKASDEEE